MFTRAEQARLDEVGTFSSTILDELNEFDGEPDTEPKFCGWCGAPTYDNGGFCNVVCRKSYERNNGPPRVPVPCIDCMSTDCTYCEVCPF